MFDYFISGGLIVDGTGAPGRRADLAVQGGRIAQIGRLDGVRAAKRFDASGLVVAPGFVDVHTHYDARDDVVTGGSGPSRNSEGETSRWQGPAAAM